MPAMPHVRTLSRLDSWLAGCERALATVSGAAQAQRVSPATDLEEAELDPRARRHAAGLMRINHTGEVCAQALYDGQALLARDAQTRNHLLHAANEETDHLVWCAQRLEQLHSRPSLFNPLWYALSHAIGMAASAFGDPISLGFVVETERQVEAHLAEHLRTLPPEDTRSRAVLEQMKLDEARHAAQAQQRGGIELPFPIPFLMGLTSKVMKTLAYRI